MELDEIPKMFLNPSFSLENTETFNAVFPWTQIEASRQESPKPKQSSKLLQEKVRVY